MNKKFQSILEYCIFLGLIAAVFAAMQLYAKRGLSSSLKVAGDAMGFHSDNAMGLDEEQQKYFKQRDPKTFGKNRIKSASRAEYDAGNYTSVDVSASESAFTGANIGHVMAPNLEDMRHTPGMVDSITYKKSSDIVAVVGEVTQHCYDMHVVNQTAAEYCGNESGCYNDAGEFKCVIHSCPGCNTSNWFWPADVYCCVNFNTSASGSNVGGGKTFNKKKSKEDGSSHPKKQAWRHTSCSSTPQYAKKCNIAYKTDHNSINALAYEPCRASKWK